MTDYGDTSRLTPSVNVAEVLPSIISKRHVKTCTSLHGSNGKIRNPAQGLSFMDAIGEDSIIAALASRISPSDLCKHLGLPEGYLGLWTAAKRDRGRKLLQAMHTPAVLKALLASTQALDAPGSMMSADEARMVKAKQTAAKQVVETVSSDDGVKVKDTRLRVSINFGAALPSLSAASDKGRVIEHE